MEWGTRKCKANLLDSNQWYNFLNSLLCFAAEDA
ncbi:hypothetical protein CCACVL1_07622 [Corchorus capsularis]|uniref:Uncharacterized protein n=1 Tax=Corchorus capsularis TaxID=210143 RepID=A0A1R3J4R5_COCAP|nr:hypothetical protein CCACVL1_07622 [Corchorus capsularis]